MTVTALTHLAGDEEGEGGLGEELGDSEDIREMVSFLSDTLWGRAGGGHSKGTVKVAAKMRAGGRGWFTALHAGPFVLQGSTHNRVRWRLG